MDFLKQLLGGKKKFFKNADVSPVNVPRYKKLSLKCVIQHIHQRADIKVYIPDGLDLEDPQIDRGFIFTVMNTCDPTYFPEQLKSIELEREAEGKLKAQDVIEVRQDILELLEQFGASPKKGGKNSSCARSLAMLKKNSKKRSRSKVDPAANDDSVASKMAS